MAKIQAVLANSSPNLLTHSDLFTIFVPTLAKAASFEVGGPSSEASLLTVVLSLFLVDSLIFLTIIMTIFAIIDTQNEHYCQNSGYFLQKVHPIS